jgi:D-glycero-D-manno-heptose 1,7-bisphosphate phosphatase
MKRAVFLDRDGVLNRSLLIDGAPKPPTSVEDVEILSGVIEAVQILRNHDFVIVVVTNQPDVSRGDTTRMQVDAINSRVGAVTNIQHFYTCFHDDVDLCECRKPLPGLIHRAAHDLDLSVGESFLVGDRWRDIAAGQAAGCENFFIDYSYMEKRPVEPFRRVSSLLEAVYLIIGDRYG